MDTELTPTQMAIEFLRRDTTVMTPAQYLKKAGNCWSWSLLT